MKTGKDFLLNSLKEKYVSGSINLEKLNSMVLSGTITEQEKNDILVAEQEDEELEDLRAYRETVNNAILGGGKE